MLRNLLIVAWCAVPLIAIAFHYGPGQPALARDIAAEHLQTARVAATQENYDDALQAFAATLSALPENDPTRPRIELERAVVNAASGNLLEGIEQMGDLLKTLSDRGEGNSELARATRTELGEAHYHAAWLMRLEGASTDEWTLEADAARQHFRLLAETATNENEAITHEKNLESTIRLQQLDLSELKGLPLPKKCSGNCQSLSQKKRKQRESKKDGKKPGNKKQQPQDIRQQMQKQKDAGAGQREDGGS